MDSQSNWLAFLEAQGAQVAGDGSIVAFRDGPESPARGERAAALVPLDSEGVVRVRGPDSAGFLQAQLTCDISGINADAASLSGYCTPQGRLLATPVVLRHGNDYLLKLPRSLAGPLATRLRRYVMRAKVEVEDASDRLVVLGLCGPQATAVLQSVARSDGFAAKPMDVCVFDATIGVALHGGRIALICTVAAARELWMDLARSASPSGPNVWRLLGIRAGVPEVLPQTQEMFLPQMLRLEQLEAVSFRKGCYPGQEIVARTQYLGDLKRRLFRGRSADMASPGDALFVADDGREPAGTIVNVATSEALGFEWLAVLHRDRVQPTLRLRNPDGAIADHLEAIGPASPIALGRAV